MRILVCGSRDYNDRGKLFAAMDKLRSVTLVIHGGAPGADSLADEWAASRGIERLPFQADWSLGHKAGPLRNQRMLEEGKPEGVVAFPGGRGTADMTRRAEAAGLKVWRPYG